MMLPFFKARANTHTRVHGNCGTCACIGHNGCRSNMTSALVLVRSEPHCRLLPLPACCYRRANFTGSVGLIAKAQLRPRTHMQLPTYTHSIKHTILCYIYRYFCISEKSAMKDIVCCLTHFSVRQNASKGSSIIVFAMRID